MTSKIGKCFVCHKEIKPDEKYASLGMFDVVHEECHFKTMARHARNEL